MDIWIEDEGQGVTPEVLARAFEALLTTREGRAGPGSPSTGPIVEKQGSKKDIGRAPDQGMEFPIALHEEVNRTESAQKGARRGKRILLMDDDEAILEVVQALMEEAGFEVDTALDGERALKMYAEAKVDRPYAVVVMDLLVHWGMGGKDAIKRLLEIDPEAKAIVASGHSDDKIMANYRQYGFAAVLHKPYRIEDLIATIGRLGLQ